MVCHAEGPASVCTASEREWHQQLLQDAEAAVFAEAAESDPQEGQAEQSREEMTRACAALGRQLVILSGNVRWAEEALDARTSEASTDWEDPRYLALKPKDQYCEHGCQNSACDTSLQVLLADAHAAMFCEAGRDFPFGGQPTRSIRVS